MPCKSTSSLGSRTIINVYPPTPQEPIGVYAFPSMPEMIYLPQSNPFQGYTAPSQLHIQPIALHHNPYDLQQEIRYEVSFNYCRDVQLLDGSWALICATNEHWLTSLQNLGGWDPTTGSLPLVDEFSQDDGWWAITSNGNF